MAHSLSAYKRARQSLKRNLRNRKVKADLKKLTKDLLSLVSQKKKDESIVAFRALVGRFDRATKGGVIHKKNASRHKSRLAQRLAKGFAA